MIIINILRMWLKKGKKLLSIEFRLENSFGDHIESVKPDPLRTIVITKAMSLFQLNRIIAIVIIWAIKSIMRLS